MVWFWESGSCPFFCNFSALQPLLNELFAQTLVINTISSPSPCSSRANLSWVAEEVSEEWSWVPELGCWNCPCPVRVHIHCSSVGRSWNRFRNFLKPVRVVLCWGQGLGCCCICRFTPEKNRWVGVLTLVGRHRSCGSWQLTLKWSVLCSQVLPRVQNRLSPGRVFDKFTY